ncbi:MAG: polysaccharide deacetylase family protein, partial [Patescibacteria group bacterium]
MVKKFVACMAAFLLTLLPVAGIASAAALTTNPIANPSVETGAATPDGWTSSWWTDTTVGGNGFTPTFEYTNDGHGDSKSVKVTVADYERTYVPGAENGTQGGALTGDNGDAKWIFSPIPTSTLQVSQQYRFNAWYKSNVIPKVVAMYCLDDPAVCENAQFFGMPAPQPGTDAQTTWQKYSDTFSIPQGATAVSVFMFLDQNGWLQSDDYSIEDYTPTDWNQPLLTLTFDDGHEDNVANALPLLTQYGFKSTQCFETGTLTADPTQAQTNVGAFFNAGHEICSHTVTHPMMTQISDGQLAEELSQSKTYLEGLIGQPVPDFASPYGDYDARVNNAIRAAGYASHRTVDEGFNSKDNFDPYRLRVQNIFNTTTAS